jgi:hyperosmotically inducible periplasmic protein
VGIIMIVRKLKLALPTAVLAGLLCSPLASFGQQPDNTAANKHEKNTPTADQAKNGTSDVKLMKSIRHDVVHDKALSTDGHNVKIIAESGKVTLKGPVASDVEKKTIEDYAKKYAGDANVDCQLTVKSK